jgi:hypothetical protein
MIGIGIGIGGIGAAALLAGSLRGRDGDSSPPSRPTPADDRRFRGLDSSDLVGSTASAARTMVETHSRDDAFVDIPTRAEHRSAHWSRHPEVIESPTNPYGSARAIDRYGLFSSADVFGAGAVDNRVDARELAAFLTDRFGSTIDAQEAARILDHSHTYGAFR